MLPFATFVVFYLNDLKIWRPSYLVRKRFCLIQREVKKSRNYLSQQYCLLIIFLDFLVCEGKFFRILMSFFDFEITMHVQLFWEFDVVFTKPNQKSASRRGNQHLKFCFCRKGKNQPPPFFAIFHFGNFFLFFCAFFPVVFEFRQNSGGIPYFGSDQLFSFHFFLLHKLQNLESACSQDFKKAVVFVLLFCGLLWVLEASSLIAIFLIAN